MLDLASSSVVEKSVGGGIVDICYRDLGLVRIINLLKKICLQKESRMWLILDLYSLSINEQWVLRVWISSGVLCGHSKGARWSTKKVT